ncbi:MAG: 7-carboxy-7-deazaguanine synthase QueE [Planctomycetota bacterium]|nr:MAG: 7-carboxy-7-deazaguanine synthase QueE [Planctomycetota bacterium]
MRIAELYASLQGEGLLAGTPSTFVRTSGCNLRCHWCDTPFTSWRPGGEERSIDAIRKAVDDLGLSHVVLTGGEPLLPADAGELCARLRLDGHHLTVETAGTVLPGGVPAEDLADLMSVSPKLVSSAPPPDTPGDWHERHSRSRRRDDVLEALLRAPQWQLKFVVDTPDDLAEVIAWLDDLDAAGVGGEGGLPRDRVFVMPQGTNPATLAATSQWLESACHAEGLRLAPRHHIAWFGNTRGT